MYINYFPILRTNIMLKWLFYVTGQDLSRTLFYSIVFNIDVVILNILAIQIIA